MVSHFKFKTREKNYFYYIRRATSMKYDGWGKKTNKNFTRNMWINCSERRLLYNSMKNDPLKSAMLIVLKNCDQLRPMTKYLSNIATTFCNNLHRPDPFKVLITKKKHTNIVWECSLMSNMWTFQKISGWIKTA